MLFEVNHLEFFFKLFNNNFFLFFFIKPFKINTNIINIIITNLIVRLIIIKFSNDKS